MRLMVRQGTAQLCFGCGGMPACLAFEIPRGSKDYFADIPELTPVPELLRLAEHILDGKLRAFDPSGFGTATRRS
jgi:hypothetical protein